MELSVILNLIVFNISVTIAKLWHQDAYNQCPQLCITLGIMIQFSYLSFMFWLNAMSFDVWSKFRYMRDSSVGRTLSSSKGMFDGFKCPLYRRYALFGSGLPLIVVAITLLMQFLPPSLTQKLTTPGIGEESCFLRSQWASFFYLYMIAGIALSFNSILFGMFAWNMVFGVWARRELESADM